MTKRFSKRILFFLSHRRFHPRAAAQRLEPFPSSVSATAPRFFILARGSPKTLQRSRHSSTKMASARPRYRASSAESPGRVRHQTAEPAVSAARCTDGQFSRTKSHSSSIAVSSSKRLAEASIHDAVPARAIAIERVKLSHAGRSARHRKRYTVARSSNSLPTGKKLPARIFGAV